jgi:DNA-3-methyladenine glycosylase
MFEAGGRLYVYFTYGMHYCLNIVVGQKGVGEAVLIRAAEPVEGTEIMQANRGITDIRNLTSGPGKLAKARGIRDTSLSGKILKSVKPARLDLSSEAGKISKTRKRYKSSEYSDIYLEAGEVIDPADIKTAPRIGIRQAVDLPWRFYVKSSLYVSKL